MVPVSNFRPHFFAIFSAYHSIEFGYTSPFSFPFTSQQVCAESVRDECYDKADYEPAKRNYEIFAGHRSQVPHILAWVGL